MNGSAGDPSGSSEPKPWERSWSTDEMRQNAHAWNLAGDTGLLKYLQEFSQTVLTHTHATEKSLDTLAEEINTLTSDVNTTNNKFLCLANTQFVENRVYDDDDKETPQDESVPKAQSKEETEAKMLQKVREALSLSVAVLDTMFEPVEIQASDSEGEAEIEQQSSKTLLLEPHNPYIHRPLPHLIGSEAFMSDDHIGLADSPSDEEESHETGMEYDKDVSSGSDMDVDPLDSNKRKMDMYSSGSSVSAGPEKISRKVEAGDPMQGVGNASEDLVEPVSSAQKPSQDNLFATQLAAKLDKIASPATSSNFVAEKTPSDNLFGGVLSDNEDDPLFSGNSGLFSSRPGLFDDLEDTNNSLWGPDEETVKKSAPAVQKVEQPSVLSKSDASNLFASNESEDEDSIFNFAKPGETKQRSEAEESHEKISEPKTSAQVVPDMQSNAQPPLVPSVKKEITDKKLAGAVPMFGKANILEGLKAKLPRRQSSSSSESSSSDPAENNTIPPANRTSDESNNYDQTPSRPPASNSTRISNNEEKEVSSSIFDVPSTGNDDLEDIFAKKPSTFSPPYSESIGGGLFADVDDEEDDLFAVRPTPKPEEKKGTPDHSKNQIVNSLLKQGENTKNSNENAGTVQQVSTKPPQSIIASKPAPEKSFKHDMYSTVPPPFKSEKKTKKLDSIFDDSDSAEEDLFFSSSASSAGSRRSQASTDILSGTAASSVEKKSLSKKGLFDDDENLFGSTPNDPDIDIFGLPKSTTVSKTAVAESKPQPSSSLFKEDVSVPNISNSELQKSKPELAVENEVKSEEKRSSNQEEKMQNEARNKAQSSSVESLPQIKAQVQPRKPEPPRTLNIRKETDPSLGLFDDSNDEDDDLFSSSSKERTLPKESVKPKTAAKPLPSVKPTSVAEVQTPVQKPDVPQPIVESLSKTEDVADGAVVSVSKLRNSLLIGGNGQPALKIDPRALLPGQKPPPRKTPSTEDKPLPDPIGISVSESKEQQVQPSELKIGFDQPTLNNATLSSVNKDRAKLGVKRRPPSNKARRESARASQNLDQSDKDSPLSPDASSIWTDSIGVVNSNGNSNNSVLSPSTDEDDLFGVPQDLPAEYENPSSTSGDIFSSPSVLSPVALENHGTKPEKSKFPDQIKEFQDSLQKNASLFLPPDIEDDSLSEKLFDTVVDTVVDTDTVVDAAPVAYTSVMGDSVPEIDTAPVTPTNAKRAMTEDDASLKTVVGPSEVISHPTISPPNDSPKSFLRKDVTAVPAIDPLNKQEQTLVEDDRDLFGNDEADEIADDHNALFPFVKKKPDSKPSSNQPLFSQTPALPSKTDKSPPRTNLGGLDEVEDNDLFSSANLKSQISNKKAPILQNKEVKTWNFSDEDDDDLFQTSAKKVQFRPSPDVPAANKDKSASPEPLVSEKNTKFVKPSQPKANNGLFSDENEDDDLFSKPSQSLKSKLKEKNPSKPSLFEDDDDDLFGSQPPKSFKPPNPRKPENEPGTSVQTQASSKVKKENVFDDPLKAFQNY